VAVRFWGARLNGKISLKLPPVAFRTRVWTSFDVAVPSVELSEVVFRSRPRRTWRAALAVTERLPPAPTPTRLLATAARLSDNPSALSSWERLRLKGRVIWTLVARSKLKSSWPVVTS